MAVEIPLLFCLLLPALSILPQAPSSPQEETHGFWFGFIPPFISSVSPSDFHSLPQDTHTHSLNRHAYIYIYSKAQSLTSRWDTLLREETGYSE